MATQDSWQAVVAALEAEGVEYVFGMPGTAKILYNALYDSKTVRAVHSREQSSGVFMAMSYSRACGRHGVCYGGPGPGMTNLMSGLLEAYATCTPLIVLSTCVSTELEGLPGFQEADQLSMAKPVTKWAVRVNDPRRVPWAMRRAFSVSMNGKPGPVYIEIPFDISLKTVDMPNYIPAKYPIRCNGSPGDIQDAIELISESERPLLVCGGGTILSQAYEEVSSLVDVYHVPVMTSASGRGIISEENPLALGLTGLYATNLGREIYLQSDLLITVGTRNEQFETGDWKMFPEGAKLIHIDIDPFEMQRNWISDVPVVGDAKTVLAHIIQGLSAIPGSELRWKGRADSIARAKAAYEKEVREECATSAVPIASKRVVKELNDVFGHDTVLVNENGSQDVWSYSFPYCRVLDAGCCVPPGNQTCMGAGVAGAIGVKLARPHQKVVCVTGDGAFQMYMRELPTAVQNRAPVTYVILNNSYLGWVRLHQKELGDRYICTSFDTEPDYAQIAEASGCYGENVSDPEMIAPALRRALDANGRGIPAVLNFKVDWTDIPVGLAYYYRTIHGYKRI